MRYDITFNRLTEAAAMTVLSIGSKAFGFGPVGEMRWRHLFDRLTEKGRFDYSTWESAVVEFCDRMKWRGGDRPRGYYYRESGLIEFDASEQIWHNRIRIRRDATGLWEVGFSSHDRERFDVFESPKLRTRTVVVAVHGQLRELVEEPQ